MSKTFKTLACAGAIALGSAASADTIRATSGFGPAHPIAVHIYPALNEKLQEYTGGAWDMQDTPSGLIAPNEMSAGLRDGVTEFGALLMPYFPAEFPEATLPSEVSILGRSNLVISAATTEYVATCAECQAEFAANSQVYLGSDATPPYNLLTVTPVRTAGDMQGLRIRTGAPLYAGLVAALGGEAAQIPSSELFESLSQGVISGTFSANHEIIANRLGDVVKYVTEMDEGVFNGAASTTASRILWDRMSPEDRAALARASQHGLAAGLFGFNADAAKAREVPGIEFIPMDETLASTKAAYNEKLLANAAQVLTDRGVTDAQAKIDRYAALVEKWDGLIHDGITADELGELRYNEIFAKLDLAAYGN